MKKKVIFWIRFVFWVMFSVIAPIGFIAYRFGIFTENTNKSLTGWGIIAMIILVIFFNTLASYVKKGMPSSLASQCMSGFCKITLPLLILSYFIYIIDKNAKTMEEVLLFITASETVAIPINPFIKWMIENNIEFKTSIATNFFNRITGKGESKK